MRIAHLSAEASPLAKTGGLGDVVGALPEAQRALGHEATVWIPLYRQAREELRRRSIDPEWVTEPFALDLGFARYQIGLLKATLPDTRVSVYMIGCDELFDRPGLYSRDAAGRDDSHRRYSVFVRAALEAMRRIGWIPNVLHAHDWHAALAPMALAWDSPVDWHFAQTSTVLTLHNLAYQGVYPVSEFVHMGLPTAARGSVTALGSLNFLKGGLLAADAITAVSPNYAWEITTPEGGFGLDAVMRSRTADLHGILNGIDLSIWDPAIDRKLPYRYTPCDLRGKEENRRTLLTMAGMDEADPGMVVGIIGRLVEQKGYDLLFPVLDELFADGIRFIFLGSGEPHYEAAVRAFSQRARGRFWGHVGFDDLLAHLIEAGCDTFLMPSRFEPCGLNQLYSLKYGTLPIVRRVGGLADTVIAYEGTNAESATGFGFDAPEPSALRETVRWANKCFKAPALWRQLMLNAMAQDYSWERSAKRYVALYEELVARRKGAR